MLDVLLTGELLTAHYFEIKLN